MGKTIDLSKTVFELVQADPDLIEVMKELGFAQIANPTMLKTVGKVMTLPKGATMRGLDLSEIKSELRRRGYTIVD